jgi:hypothetical protein
LALLADEAIDQYHAIRDGLLEGVSAMYRVIRRGQRATPGLSE